MNHAAEIGEMIGKAIARRDVTPPAAPVVHLNVPDVKISAKLDETAIVRGIEAILAKSGIANRESAESIVSRLSEAFSAAFSGIPVADFSDIASAVVRLADETKPNDYSRQFQMLLVEIAGVRAAIDNQGTLIAEYGARVEAALLAEKTMKYDDQGRVVSVKTKKV